MVTHIDVQEKKFMCHHANFLLEIQHGLKIIIVHINLIMGISVGSG